MTLEMEGKEEVWKVAEETEEVQKVGEETEEEMRAGMIQSPHNLYPVHLSHILHRYLLNPNYLHTLHA